MKRRSNAAVPEGMARQIDEALTTVDVAVEELARATTERAPLRVRRTAHANLSHALDVADVLLREATAAAKEHSYREWALWRHRLSRLDTTRQLHLFAALDESRVLPLEVVRAIDTGLSGPDIGDLQHGEAQEPGTPPAYGLDLEGLLNAARLPEQAVLDQVEKVPEDSPQEAAPIDLSIDRVGVPLQAA